MQYFVGFFDGEGSISITRRKTPTSTILRVQVQVTQHVKNRIAMEYFHRVLGGRWGEYTNNNGTEYILLSWHGSHARQVLHILQKSSLTYKGQLASLALRVLDAAPGRNNGHWDQSQIEEFVRERNNIGV